MKTIAAVDLGSNAMRAQIVRVENGHITVVHETREPLRLGEDVFDRGTISPQKMQMCEEAFIRLLHLFAAHDVQDVKAIATSAMRDARNGHKLIHEIEHCTGISIGAISGKTEARLIYKAVTTELHLGKKNAVLIDIGGGSTEITIIVQGKIKASHSFNVGTVRLLRHSKREDLEVRINLMVYKILRFIRQNFKGNPPLVIGTGGNLRRIGKIRKKILGKSSESCLYPEIAHMADTLFGMTFMERIRKLELDRGRADVILPATLLVKGIMKGLKAEKILLPKVGLKEGIILSMLDPKPRRFIHLD